MQFITSAELPSRRKEATPNEVASITMPARIVFFRPIFEAIMPTGR